MKVIGLCGGSGSGKGVVSSLFASLGIPAIDTDAVYRELILSASPCTMALTQEFGKEILSVDGSINRSALSKLVFCGENSDYKLSRLNTITHKYILDETRKRLEKYKASGCVAAIVDAPVLFESGFNKECDLIVSVIAEREVRVNRIIQRDNISVEAAEARISKQLSNEELISKSDFVIENNSDLNSLAVRVNEVADFIMNN
jgi:dephospho-CoA kinase